jgi:DDE superfamily endonuclease
MLTLPTEWWTVIVSFAPLFAQPVWEHVKVLIVGALLAPGQRTVTAALRVMGVRTEKNVQTYHRLLKRATWSVLAASRILLRLAVAAFGPCGTLVFGLDDTLERRRRDQSAAQGMSRDPVRSSPAHLVKARGLRWLCCMLRCAVGWAARVWALPVLPGGCPAERGSQQQGRQHQTLIERAWQIIPLGVRWRPHRAVVFVAASSFAVLELLHQVSGLAGASLITRWRLDAALYAPAPVRRAGQTGRPRLQGARRPTLQRVREDRRRRWHTLQITHWEGGGPREVAGGTETAIWYHTGLPPVAMRWVLMRDPHGKCAPQAGLSTHVAHTPQQIREWFVRRWTMEVTCEEVRAHLGVETQRQWNNLAIARTTPALLGWYSLVPLTAPALLKSETRVVRGAAWYTKAPPTFSDALALVRTILWSQGHFSMSSHHSDAIKIPHAVFERLTDTTRRFYVEPQIKPPALGDNVRWGRHREWA